MKRKICKFAAWVLSFILVAVMLPLRGYNGVAKATAVEQRIDFRGYTSPKSATIEANGWEINGEETDVATYVTNAAWIGGNQYGINIMLPKTVGAQYAIDFEVEHSGVYTFEIEYRQHPSAGIPTDVYIDGVKIGSVNFKGAEDTRNTDGTSIAFADMEFELEAGSVHTLTFKRTDTVEYCTYPAAIVLKPWDGEQKIDFRGYTSPKSATIEANGWEINGEETDAATYVTNAAWIGGNQYGLNIMLPRTVGAQYAIDFEVEHSGVYTFEIEYRQHPSAGIPTDVYIDGVKIGSVNFKGAEDTRNTDGTSIAFADMEFELEAGSVHTLTFKRTDTVEHCTYPAALVLKYVSDTTRSVFADQYAYVRESFVDGQTVYNVIFIGATKAIEGYKSIGFEYSVDGGSSWTQKKSQNVYDKLVFNGGDLAGDEFGAPYIFYQDCAFEGVSADAEVQFRAYAEKADGEIVRGDECVITITK